MPLRVAILADYAEEGWPSMDLVADMLARHLALEHAARVEPTLVRPPLRRRRWAGRGAQPTMLERVIGRMWDYPRHLRRLPPFDAYHLVDHSYSQLLHELPSRRTVVTCHDIDTFRSVLEPAAERRWPLFRAMTHRILRGFRSAAHVACTTESTRSLVVTRAGIDRARTSVVHNGVDPLFTAAANADGDERAAALLGPSGQGLDLLHVGSTIPRKRIEDLIRIVAGLQSTLHPVRLVRVGGTLTAGQAALARDLGVSVVLSLPFVPPEVLAAIYRRCALLLLPSEREGFGLPLAEALACGLPAVASDIPALREVGGDAVTYCPVADIEAWVAAATRLLRERRDAPLEWQARQSRAAARASQFSWTTYAARMADIYEAVARAC